jgi:uncharacterized DUF497 family protein
MNSADLPQPIDFEWDAYNSTKVRLRHNIDTREAEQSFFQQSIIIFDHKHSSAEQRYQLVGITDNGRVLFIVFTLRGVRIRILSARLANKKERNYYYAQKTEKDS